MTNPTHGNQTHESGIHHITALTSNPAKNVAFYAGLLGLRLVKRTVNFDDPGTWHLYYGDGIGSPGTILTFFPYPGLAPGRHGIGQAVEITFAVPQSALSFWIDRLVTHRIDFEGPIERFEQKVIRFRDPDGLQLEIVADSSAPAVVPWSNMPVPPDQAIRGFHGVTLWEENLEQTARILTEILGYRAAGQEDSRFRFVARTDHAPGRIVDIRHIPGFWTGASGAGTVHHVAFRAADDAVQAAVRERAAHEGIEVTPVRDRNYFRSIYFREPGGVLFEVATDSPGFAIDEPVEQLGTGLKLPAWLEPRRASIAAILPDLGIDAAPLSEEASG
ncbi:MAG: ring-cleaving dioxygenase [Roseiflexaceae bacterium]|nr:ring-cleaving dioxygenase [Roseiflexus sp.]MDW8213960.1 ring-cleaving dioxygenase [Roseiflexaceae bacterium]